MAGIHDSILDAIGNTPLVRLRTIGKNTGCEILVKCEHLNAGGSVKDRIGKRMIEEAEKAGRIKPGDTLIEPTSGNTGIGMALAAAVYGYRMIITMPEKMSREKQVVARGARGRDHPHPDGSRVGLAGEPHRRGEAARRRSCRTRTSSISTGTRTTRSRTTRPRARRSWIRRAGELDYLVLTAGTGGTITGAAKKHQGARCPHCRIVIGVDPVGSILAGRRSRSSSYKVEGIGYDFVPDVLDRSVVDEWIKTNDRDSFLMARRLIRQEGMLVGGSSGAAAWAAVEVAKKYGPDKRIVTMMCDSVRNYMTKFLDDAWMRENGFTESLWETSSLGELLRSLPKRELITVRSADTVGATIATLKEKGISQVPVVDDDQLVGIVTESDLLRTLIDGRATPESAVAEVMFRNVETVNVNEDAGVLTGLFARDLVGVVVDDAGRALGILSPMDLVEHLTRSPARA